MKIMQATDNARVAYLDGLRGVAALVVFMNHLLTSFVPAVASLGPQAAKTSFFGSLVLSPLAVLCSGNFAVCIFFVLSGYVLSDFSRRTRLSFPAQLVRRYCRLALPVLITSIFAWALLYFGLYNNQIASKEVTHSGWLPNWYNFNPNFLNMMKEALYDVFVSGQANYNCNIWTMQLELMGSAYVFALFALLKNRYLRLIAVLAFMGSNYQGYYILFAWAVLLYDFQPEIAAFLNCLFRKNLACQIFLFLGFTASVYIGGYPITPPEIVSPWYPGFNHFLSAIHWHTVAAMLLVLFLLHSKPLQNLFACRLGRFFGKISFVLYLIHVPIICSLTSWLIYACKALPYYQMLLISVSTTIVSVILLSVLLYRYIDVQTTAFSRWIGDWLDSRISAASKSSLTPENVQLV